MIVDVFYKFDWKIQPLGENPNFIHYNINEKNQSIIFHCMTYLLHRVFYLWENGSIVFNSQTSEPLNTNFPNWYYANLNTEQKVALYFLYAHKNWAYCFDKELLKLYWSEYALEKDDSFNKEKVLQDMFSKLFWKGAKITDRTTMLQQGIDFSQKSTCDELQALMWLAIIHKYMWDFKTFNYNWFSKVVSDFTNKCPWIWKIYEQTDWSLHLFYKNYDVIEQTKTFINFDFWLFHEFMVKFLRVYNIEEWLWWYYLASLYDKKDYQEALLETWSFAIKQQWHEHENTYGFFYLLWQFCPWPSTSSWDNLFAGKKTFLGLYNELKKREARLMENFRTQESIFAFMAIEFFTYTFYFIWRHNANLSWKNKPHYNTKGKMTFMLNDLLDIIQSYSYSWFIKDIDNHQVFPRTMLPQKTFFSTMTSTPIQEITREEFEEENHQIRTTSVSRIRNSNNRLEDLNPVEWYPYLITLYSKQNYFLDNTEAGKQTITPTLEKLMLDNQPEIKQQIKAQIVWAEEQEDFDDFPWTKPEKTAQQIEDDVKKQTLDKQMESVISSEELNELEKEVFSETFTAEELYNELKKYIFWQDALLKHMAKKIYSYLVLKRENNKPLTFFLVWPPGSWKTYLSEVLVKVLNNFIKVEKAKFNAQSEIATNYSDKSSLSKLLWASASFVWHWDKINFFEELLKKQNQIILFDEIEKGDPSLYPFFLDFMNNGKLESNDGQYGIYMWNKDEISFLPKWEQVKQLNNVILIFASNAITSQAQVAELSGEEFAQTIDCETYQKEFIGQNRQLRDALRNWKKDNKTMDAAFLDRLQLIYLFNALWDKDLNNIVLHKFEKILKEYKIDANEKKTIKSLFKKEFLKSEVMKNMKDASSMREVQAIIDDWVSEKVSDLKEKE